MKKLLYIIPPVLLIAVVLAVFILPARMTVAVTDDTVSIDIGSGIQYADTPGVLSDWTIRFEPSGTHVKDGYLKVRLDFYPSESSKIYLDCYVLNEESGLYQLNPALCHFIRVPVSITKEQLTDYIKDKFNLGVVSTLDEILIQENRGHLLSNYFNALTDKLKYNEDKAPAIPSNLFIPQVNSNLAGLSVSGSEKVIDIESQKPGSIVIGPGATNRAQSYPEGSTRVDQNVPADGTGTLDTWELWFASNGDGVEVATFYVVSGNNLSTRDTETIGAVTSGSKQTFTGLTTDVVIGDYPGIYWTSGDFERESTGTGIWIVSGDYIPCTNQAFTLTTSRTISIYATGTESGGTVSISNAPSSKAFGVIWPSSTYWSNTGNSTGFTGTLEDAEAFFTITNDGTVAVDVAAKCTNFTGGVSCNLTHSSPGLDTLRISLFKEGDSSSGNLTLKTTDQSFISGLAASGNTTDWEVKLEVGTWSDLNAKTGTITLTASAS